MVELMKTIMNKDRINAEEVKDYEKHSFKHALINFKEGADEENTRKVLPGLGEEKYAPKDVEGKLYIKRKYSIMGGVKF